MKLSIVIPVYKSYDLLERCLDSVYEQINSNDNVDIIVIDDTPSEFRKEISTRKRTNLLVRCNNKNMGVTYSRNKGWFLSDADYVIFLDSDDYLAQSAIANILNQITLTNADLLFFRTVSQESRLVGKVMERRRYEGVDGLVDTYNTGERMLCLKKSIKKPFVSTFRGHEFAGLINYINKVEVDRFISVDTGVMTRVYCSDNSESISKGNELRRRNYNLVAGHFFASKYFFKRSDYIMSTLWFLRAIKGKFF
ncbi:glycosyltransferase family 2 protein [Vibrio parahaemolyticus]